MARVKVRAPLRPRVARRRLVERLRPFATLLALALAAMFVDPAGLTGHARANDPAGEADRLGAALFQAHVAPPGVPGALLAGLGPTYNVEGCAGCHPGNGRGRPPMRRGEPLRQMVVRLSIEQGGAISPHPAYGVQLNGQAVAGATPEGQAFVEYSSVKGRYGDGTPFELLKPHYGFLDMAFGRLDEAVRLTARVPPQVTGVGLLEAVPEAAILARADPSDLDHNGISGRANNVLDLASGSERLGRFGWKATQPSLRQQAADAARIDMGLTSTLFPHEDCPVLQNQCARLGADRSVELSDSALEALVTYLRDLKSPAPDPRATAAAREGSRLFVGFGCSACHVLELPVGRDAALPPDAPDRIAAFTDLLLHDMGEGLADHRPDHGASGSEWRTAPLWGIAAFEAGGGGPRYLHDGRARDLAEAILWHGGEASIARERFRVARATERAALIAYLRSR